MKVLAILPAFLVLVSLCGSPGPAPSASPASSPSHAPATARPATAPPRAKVDGIAYPITPTPSATPDISTIDLCRAEDLVATWGMEQPANSYGSAAAVHFANKTDVPCWLEGTPEVTLTQDSSGSQELRVSRGQVCFQGLTCPHPLFAVVPPGGPGQTPDLRGAPFFEVSWGNPVELNGKCDAIPPLTRMPRITLPGGDSLPVGRGAGPGVGVAAGTELAFSPYCNDVHVSPILPTGYFHAPLPGYPVSITMHEHWNLLRAGSNVPVTIIITNVSDVPISFSDPCPVATLELAYYEEYLQQTKYTARQQAPLDCDSQRTIEPGGEATFSYTLSVPADIQNAYNSWSLHWFVGDGSDPRGQLRRFVLDILPPLSPTP